MILELAACARYKLPPTKDLQRTLNTLTTLLPPQELNPLTVGDLRHAVPAPKTRSSWAPEPHANLAALRAMSKPLLDDERLLAIWPVRSKMDLSIRRSRFREPYTCYHRAGKAARLWSVCERLPGFDLISVVNILNAEWILSTDTWSWFDFYDSLGAFSSDVTHYGAVTKVVNDLAKKRSLAPGLDMFRIAECGVMTGYRNPPFPGFDVVEETRKLADGGVEYGLKRERESAEFQEIADEILDVDGHPVEWVSFEDYVTQAKWETTGSSTVGKVQWEAAGETGHFKARKNLVPDVYPLADLAWEAREERDQVNRAITKAELGKLRMAVAGDMYTYLKMSWITYLVGGAYLKWPGSTIEEDKYEQTDRMLTMLKNISKAWNLPFDYAAFDHQPTTFALKVIMAVLVRIAKRNVSLDHHEEVEEISRNVLEGMDRATLSVRTEDGKTHTFPVTGGLESGLRWTTVVGNGWNTVMSEWVTRLLARLGVPTDVIRRWIRGDDSAIVTDTYAGALLFRQGYEAINAQGSDGKFGIHYGQSEFLRVWYRSDGCHGYMPRAVPGLQQRKPWNAAPWDEESTMAHIFDTVRTLRRRGADPSRIDGWWRACKLVWSQVKHLSQDWLQVPKHLGGLGVEPWDGRTFPKSKWPRTPRSLVRISNMTNWRAQQIQKSYETWLPVTSSEAQSLAESQASDKMSTDDIPQINRVYREHSEKPTVSSFERADGPWNIPGLQALRSLGLEFSQLPAEPGAYQRAMRNRKVGSFGAWSHLLQKWKDAAAVFRLRKERNLLQFFRQSYPDFYSDVSSLERRGLARWEALDWLFGESPSNVSYALHPTMTSLLHRGAVEIAAGFIARCKLRPRQLSQLIALSASHLERSLSSSRLVRQVYAW